MEKLLEMSIYDVADLGTGKFLRPAIASLTSYASVSVRSWFLKSDGSNFPAIICLVMARNQSSEVAINMLIIDDTFNYNAREKARLDNEDSQRKEQLKNEFIAIASHELRTPIQPILGFALLARKGKISQEQAWEGVLKEARRLQQLANDILDASRIESNTIAYRMESVRLNDLIRIVIDSFGTDNNKGLSILFTPTEPPVEVEADRSRITQVFTNLIGNAVKFTQAGMISVKCGVIRDGTYAEVSISDTGPGIPEDIVPKLFGKFVTKSHGEALINQGTGLGLYICKAIVSAHGGVISAKNNDDKVGATFTVELPVTQTK